MIRPQLKNGKQPNITTSYRPISSTSCICKGMRPLVWRRLTWLLEQQEALSDELSGFRRGRYTADAISDLVTDLEATKSAGDTAYVISLDVCRAFDSLHHATFLSQLRAYNVELLKLAKSLSLLLFFVTWSLSYAASPAVRRR